MVKRIKGEEGSLTVEFAMLLPLFGLMIMFMITIYTFVNGVMEEQEIQRMEVLRLIYGRSGDAFKSCTRGPVVIESSVSTYLRKFFGETRLSVKVSSSAYGGCFQGDKNTKYTNGKRYKQFHY